MAETATILLVDDQPRNLDALEAILESPDYRMLRARSANEALLMLLKEDCAAIICDIQMPDISGIELAQMIKQRRKTQHIPILFLTAYRVEDADILRGYGVGAVDYISKPVSPEILRSKIAVFVELFRKNRALAQEVRQRQIAQEELRVAKEQLEERVEQRTAELSSANRAKDHFLAVLSHELRTPLTPVLAVVQEMLRNGDLQEKYGETLDLIHRNVELEARLIDDLLDLTRISRGKMELQRSLVDLHQVIEHAMRTCEVDFRSKQIAVDMSLDAKQTIVLGDRARLLQIVWNLLKNAAKFTPFGNRVELRTSSDDQSIRFEVRDTGIGIEPDRLPHVFDAFEQGDQETTRRYGGLGLGLSISKAMVDLHGGTISAMSEGLDRGATFTVELPLAVDSESPCDQPDTLLHVWNPMRSESDTALRLLLVEDHTDTRKVMERLLFAAGYEITSADSVASAIRSCDAAPCPFDLMVSDLGLPDGSGLDLMRQLRVRYPHMPAVALSGFGMDSDRQKSADAGFVAHLTKPVDLVLLRQTIERVLQPS